MYCGNGFTISSNSICASAPGACKFSPVSSPANAKLRRDNMFLVIANLVGDIHSYTRFTYSRDHKYSHLTALPKANSAKPMLAELLLIFTFNPARKVFGASRPLLPKHLTSEVSHS